MAPSFEIKAHQNLYAFFVRIYYRERIGDSPCGLLVTLHCTRRVSRQMAPSFDKKREKLISKCICLSAFLFFYRAAWLVELRKW
jgi:hypothetical protein